MPGSYERRFSDFYQAVVVNDKGEKIFFSKDEFISYLTQVNFKLARSQGFFGNLTLTDNQLIYPKGIQGFTFLAHTITPARKSTFPLLPVEQFLIGFKICVGERLLVILNNSNRYAYDCGKFEKWQKYFKGKLNDLTTVDMYFIWYVYKYSRDKIKLFPNELTLEFLNVIRDAIVEFNDKERGSVCSKKPFDKGQAEFIAKFFIETELDCLIEVSYREIGLAINGEIKKNSYTDVQVTKAFRDLVNGEKSSDVIIKHLPLLVVVTMISEHGRNYYSTFANLLLLDLLESDHKTIATKDSLHWVNAIMPDEIYDLNKNRDKNNSKITNLAKIGGYFCMTHTSSFYENVLPLEGSLPTEAFYLRQSLIYETLSPELIGPNLYWMLTLSKQTDEKVFFSEDNQLNLSKEKSFMIIAEWLKFKDKARILSKKEFNNLKKDKSSVIREGKLIDFIRIIFPMILNSYGFSNDQAEKVISNPNSAFYEGNFITISSGNLEEKYQHAEKCLHEHFVERMVNRTVLVNLLASQSMYLGGGTVNFSDFSGHATDNNNAISKQEVSADEPSYLGVFDRDTLLKNVSNSYNLHPEDVTGDGNCMYYSFLLQAKLRKINLVFENFSLSFDEIKKNDSSQVLQLRKEVGMFLSKNRGIYEHCTPKELTWDKYLDKVSKLGNDAEDPEIQALSAMFGINVVIVPDNNNFRPYVHRSQSVLGKSNTIVIGYQYEMKIDEEIPLRGHYQSLNGDLSARLFEKITEQDVGHKQEERSDSKNDQAFFCRSFVKPEVMIDYEHKMSGWYRFI